VAGDATEARFELRYDIVMAGLDPAIHESQKAGSDPGLFSWRTPPIQPLSSSAKADDPVFHALSILFLTAAITGYPPSRV
jgi:hypothetical protein